jgi:hypothetical protein
MKRREEHLIARVDHNYFHGFVVTIKRAGKRSSTYFSDKPNGRAAALRQARAYRDTRLDQLPPPVKIKRQYSRNTTGVIGVALTSERTRQGKILQRYKASWPRADGSQGTATFSVGLYGKREALRRAVEARRKGLADLGLL